MKTRRRHRPNNGRKDWSQNKTALITGASSGIGYDLASVFAQHGYNVVLVARSREKLHALAHQLQTMFGISAKVVTADLADAASPERVFRELHREAIPVDVLVNNAGFGTLGKFAFMPKDEELALTQVNVLSVVHLTRLFLPPMIQRGHGHVLNVASTAGFQPGPLMSNYYASKAFVVNFSVGLAHEVKGTGVSVSVLCPGQTATGFQARAGIKKDLLWHLVNMDSRVVARVAYEGMLSGKTIIVPGFLNKIGTSLVRLLPLNVIAHVLSKAHEHRKNIGTSP